MAARKSPAQSSRVVPRKRFASAGAWERWLDAEHAKSTGIWLQFAKLDSGIASISHSDALEIALCFGWIDGQKDRLDAKFWLQKFTPRSPKSPWSKVNCAKVTKLAEQGRLRSAGVQAIEKAKADGRWDRAYDSQRGSKVPPDLERALKAMPSALRFFGSLDSHNRYAVLYRVQTAKKPETRARRIATFVAMLAEGRALYAT